MSDTVTGGTTLPANVRAQDGGNYSAFRRPKSITPLELWRRARGITVQQISDGTGICYLSVLYLCDGRRIPSLINAFRIEQYTSGGVRADAWLGTELGRSMWKYQEEKNGPVTPAD